MILKYPSLIVIALIVQCLCAAFFLADIVNTAFRLTRVPISWQVHEAIEIGAFIGLILGAVMVGLMLRASLARTAHVESELRVASGAFQELLEDRFTQWALTPAERDVALFAIKGASTAEIAQMRETSEGTVKAQTNAIYRKAGVGGRSQLVSLFVEELMADPLV
ncbi:MAG: LuxR C-terminal-related transcriptional regulator [Litoreibacter sp.]|nr:LuxR C-terminal-related transcriptional regulator [Litoreibacter sp.]